MSGVPRFVWLLVGVLVVLAVVTLWVEHVSVHVH
jgi:uncharacterized membrane protein